MYRNVALLLLIALTSSASDMPETEEMVALMEKCAAEVDIDPEIFNQSMLVTESIMEKPHMKCYMACIMKERKIINENGTLNVEKAIEDLPPHISNREKMIEAIKECANKKGENDCETANEFLQCISDGSSL